MYSSIDSFMYNFIYKCLGSAPGPRPQWELGQDWDQGPARPRTRAQQLPLRPWPGPDPRLLYMNLYMKPYMNLYMKLYMKPYMNLYMKPYMNLYMKLYMNLYMKPYMK